MKKMTLILLPVFVCIIILSACKKKTDTPLSTNTSTANILASEANVVIAPTYVIVANDVTALYQGIIQFQSSPTQANLNTCKQLWLTATKDYEQTEAFLFGPATNTGIDGLVNAYPIDTFGVDTIVRGNAVLNQDYISALPGFMIGLHCIEYELYGANGNKTVAAFTPRQISYIAALALNVQSAVLAVDSAWNPSVTGNYNAQFVSAGNGSTVYPDQRAAYSDMIMAIANMSETDAIYKLNAPFATRNIGMEESPFANNSIQNIKNNIIGIENIYLGTYNQQGYGLTNLVQQYNPPFDVQIKSDINNVLKALDLITLPLNQAITRQPAQVRNAMNMLDVLDDDLKNDLQLFVDKHTN